MTLVINWSSLFINGAINFVIPIVFYVMSRNSMANVARARRYVEYLKTNVQLERADPKHADSDAPTPSEATLLMVHASVAARRRRRQVQHTDEGDDEASAASASRSTSLIYDQAVAPDAAADAHFTAWPWGGDRAVALALIAIVVTFNLVAIGVQIYVCAKHGECQ